MPKNAKIQSNEKFLDKLGVNDYVHREIIIRGLPCGISSVQEAYEDGTPWQINAPRAILVCYWKGMVQAFRELESQQSGKE